MNMDRDTPLILPDYFLRYAECLKQLGFDPSELASQTQTRETSPGRSPFGVSVNQVSQILKACYDQLKIPYLGLALGNQMRLTVHGMAGVSVMAQPTYADCLRAAGRFCERAFPPFTMEYFETADTVGLNIIECLSLAPYSHFYIESIAVNFYNILHFLLGNEQEPEYIAFAYPEPAYSKEYKRYFKCKIRFNAEHHAFVVPKRLAQRELQLADLKIARMAEQEFLQSLPNTNLNDLRRNLRLLLIQSMGMFPSLEATARKLGMSGRTLRRQLKTLGTNFQNELDLLRQEFATGYLIRSDRCITDIALMLGFCDSSAFSKAFKKWTGESPSEFKQKHALKEFRYFSNGDVTGGAGLLPSDKTGDQHLF